MSMDSYDIKDDEILVLGMNLAKDPEVIHRGGTFVVVRWVIRIGLLLCIIVVCWFVAVAVRKYYRNQQELKGLEEIVRQDVPLYLAKSQLTYTFDAGDLNDVPLHIYSVDNVAATLTMDETAIDSLSQADLVVAVLATDIRKDNLLPVGDFVVNGQRLSRGKSRLGYCAILQGQISIGVSEDDAVMDYCLQQGGSFFREYPLVMHGEICQNNVRGKKIRRALVKQSNDIYVIESENRESLYDFSEALKDLGVETALNLPGGINFMMLKGDGIECERNRPEAGGNYLVFRPYHSVR